MRMKNLIKNPDRLLPLVASESSSPQRSRISGLAEMLEFGLDYHGQVIRMRKHSLKPYMMAVLMCFVPIKDLPNPIKS